MSDVELQIFQWLSSFAYQPFQLYGVIILLMFASSFGLPFPEEIVLISAGLVAYAASRPDLFPPPEVGAASVHGWTVAFVCFASVFFSDLMVFMLGRMFAKPLSKHKHLGKWVDPERSPRLEELRAKYGVWACGIFRFTPGLRFPGHLSCGAIGIPVWKFVAIDGAAALISVPTQVILISIYGNDMLAYLKKFKVGLGIGLGALAVVYVVFRIRKWWIARKPAVTLVTGNAQASEEKRVA